MNQSANENLQPASDNLNPSTQPAPAPAPAAPVPQAITSDPAPTPPSPPAAPAIPGPEMDAELEKEVEAALGGASLMDLGMEEAARDLKDQPVTIKKQSAPGVVSGRVLSIAGDGIFVDLGGKSQGFLPIEEFEGEELPREGMVLKVVIARYDSRDGLLILSKKTAEQRLLVSNLHEGSLVEARITGVNKGGLDCDIKGLRAFLPASQCDLYRIENLDTLIGQKMTCEVTQVEKGDKNIVLSRRNVLEREREQQKEQAWQQIQEGQTIRGKVRSIMDYGAFVDLGGVDGLLHVREISWARVNHPSDILQVGQSIDVLVIGIDREKKRISLSLRQAGLDPWSTAEMKYPAGSRHQAQIKNLMDFGAFAELEPGVEGLIPVSQMTWTGRVRHPSDVVQPGQMVEVEIISIDLDKKKISLSMKKLQANPWDNIQERYHKDEIVTGVVARLADFGAFVTLESGVDGLVHISALSEKRVNRVADVVQPGQTVQVKVLEVDPKAQRISLTMRGLAPEPEAASAAPAAAEITLGSGKPAKKKERPRRGGLTWDF